MTKETFDINNLRIASPCPKDWKGMAGDDRKRFCSLCELSVYNVAGMTTHEVQELMSAGSGRMCLRLHRRADGTVITRDCPVGLRNYRKRVATLSTAAFAAVLSLFSISYGQKDKDASRMDASKGKVVRSVDPVGKSGLYGTIVDRHGAVVPGAEILLYQKNKKLVTNSTSDANGKFGFDSLPTGIYEVRVRSVAGFRQLIVENLEIRDASNLDINLPLDVDEETVFIGVVADPGIIDFSSNERKMVITRGMLDRLPGGGRPFD